MTQRSALTGAPIRHNQWDQLAGALGCPVNGAWIIQPPPTGPAAKVPRCASGMMLTTDGNDLKCLAWTGSWTGAASNPSAVGAVSAMSCVIGAASAHGASGRTSCNQPVRHEQSLETDHQQAALRCGASALRCASLSSLVPVKTFCTPSRRPVGPLAPPTRRARLRSRYGGASAGRLARKHKTRAALDAQQLPGFSCGRGCPTPAVGIVRVGQNLSSLKERGPCQGGFWRALAECGRA